MLCKLADYVLCCKTDIANKPDMWTRGCIQCWVMSGLLMWPVLLNSKTYFFLKFFPQYDLSVDPQRIFVFENFPTIWAIRKFCALCIKRKTSHKVELLFSLAKAFKGEHMLTTKLCKHKVKPKMCFPKLCPPLKEIMHSFRSKDVLF